MYDGTLIIVRHGRTVWNLEKRLQGRLGSPLLESAKEQLKNIGSKITKEYSIDESYCSPMDRARDSFFISFPNIIPKYCDELSEIDHGVCEGRLVSDIDFNSIKENLWNIPWEGGESYKDLNNRVVKFINNLNGGKTVLLMGHENVNKLIIGNLLKLPIKEAIKIRHPNHVCYVITNNKIRLFDYNEIDYEGIYFKEL